MPLSTFSTNLRIARNNRGWSQREAAMHIGISLSTYGSYEESRAEPCHDILVKICKAYDVSDLEAFISDEQYFTRVAAAEQAQLIQRLEKLNQGQRVALRGLMRALLEVI